MATAICGREPTIDRKYQIFVSSTYDDLREERNEVIKACLNMGHIPVGMEMFNAADEEQWAVITRTIDQCDYYVVIVAHRYGSTTPDGTSFTEKEYDYAVAQGVPVLGFVIEEGARWPSDRVDKEQVPVEALRRFKSKVKQRMVRFWHDRSELQAHFAMSLSMTINITPQRGWVRAAADSDEDVSRQIARLVRENATLRDKLANIEQDANPGVVKIASLLISSEERDEFILCAEKSSMRESLAFTVAGTPRTITRFTTLGLLNKSIQIDRTMYSLTPLGSAVYLSLISTDPKHPD